MLSAVQKSVGVLARLIQGPAERVETFLARLCKSFRRALSLALLAHHLQGHLLSAAAELVERARLVAQSTLQVALSKRALGIAHGVFRIPEVFRNLVGHFTELAHEFAELSSHLVLSVARRL